MPHLSIQPYRFACAAIALALLSMVLTIGHSVGAGADPAWLMSRETSWVNHSTLIAWWITWLGWIDVLLPLAIACAVIAFAVPAWRSRIMFAIVSLVVAWRGTDLLQHLFARPRRLDWVVKHETSFSYPSSHAAIATAFYLLLAVFVARSTLPGRALWSAVLAVVALAIMWSRLDLGAHYLTDVLGGFLLGGAIAAALAACWPANVSSSRGGPARL